MFGIHAGKYEWTTTYNTTASTSKSTTTTFNTTYNTSYNTTFNTSFNTSYTTSYNTSYTTLGEGRDYGDTGTGYWQARAHNGYVNIWYAVSGNSLTLVTNFQGFNATSRNHGGYTYQRGNLWYNAGNDYHYFQRRVRNTSRGTSRSTTKSTSRSTSRSTSNSTTKSTTKSTTTTFNTTASTSRTTDFYS